MDSFQFQSAAYDGPLGVSGPAMTPAAGTTQTTLTGRGQQPSAVGGATEARQQMPLEPPSARALGLRNATL
jgi:hypothetical protein